MNENNYKPVIILGAGGHAKVVAEMLFQIKREVLGFVTPDIIPNTPFFKSTILGGDDAIHKYSPDDIELANGVGSLPHQDLRWRLAAQLREQGYYFTTIIHPSAIIASDVELDEGVQVMAGSVIQSSTRIGRDSIINTGTLVDHDCEIAEDCHLAPGVTCSGGVKIGARSHLGSGTTVIQSIIIGRQSVIAAGSVIYRNAPSEVTSKQVQ